MLDTRQPNPTLIRAYRAVAVTTVALIFLQAVLAGQYWYNDEDAIDVHGFVSNIVSLVVIAQLLLAVRSGFNPVLRMPLWTALLLVLVVVQIGFGYIGRDTADIAAIHVPTGVLVFGVALLVTLLSFLEPAEREGPHEPPGGNGNRGL